VTARFVIHDVQDSFVLPLLSARGAGPTEFVGKFAMFRLRLCFVKYDVLRLALRTGDRVVGRSVTDGTFSDISPPWLVRLALFVLPAIQLP